MPEPIDRDQLYADLIAADDESWERMADNLLAAGWRKTRPVTTGDELADLPEGSVILHEGDVFVLCDYEDEGGLLLRDTLGDTHSLWSIGASVEIPALVLWTPGGAL